MRKFKKVYIEITNVCNLSCNFCPKTKREYKFMNKEEFTYILNEVIERIDCEHKAEVFRQDALRVKDRRRVHPDHAQDVPQELHIAEEHHGGGEQQAQTICEEDETKPKVKC